MNDRFEYIDTSKGIGILMVVWAHIMLTGWTHEFIYAFHMPLFFLLSGMLFQRGKYNSIGSFIVHRAKRLFIPYVIYSVLTWILWAAFRYVRHDEVESYVMPLMQTFIAQGSGAYIVHNSALWFIPCLFMVEILYYFICAAGKWWSLFLCFGGAILSFMLGSVYGADYWFLLPWNADAALIALPFYCVGNLVAKEIGLSRLKTYFSENKMAGFVGWVLLGCILFWSATSYGECSMGSSSYGCAPWIFIIRAFIGCAWLVGLALLIDMIRVHGRVSSTIIDYLKWTGVKSLDIMCLHIPAKGVCMIVVAALVGITVDDVSMSPLWSGVSFLITMFGVWVAMKIVPVDRLSQAIAKRL